MLLLRVDSSRKRTMGILLAAGLPPLVTLEPPWRNNAPKLSSIPLGTYLCQRVNSPKFGDTFEVTDVEGRENILFHTGNWVKDTEGCILLGTYLDYDMNQIFLSKDAFRKWHGSLSSYREFYLSIEEHTWPPLLVKSGDSENTTP